MSDPFDRVRVDAVQLPVSDRGNKYAAAFIDYMSKGPEVYAVPDQSSLTITQLLVKHVISHHGVPSELFFDRGAALVSDLLKEVYQIRGIPKLNTTAYHPQMDGL